MPTPASRFPDFRAEERTFQLVTQLAGRSGRDAPGKVLVQTFQPDAIPFAFAIRHDVAGFLARELVRREELGYPPFSHLVSIVVSGAEPAAPLTGARRAPRRPRRKRAPACSGRRRCSGFAAGTAPSSSRRRRPRERSRAVPQPCSPQPRRPCVATGLSVVVDVDPQSL